MQLVATNTASQTVPIGGTATTPVTLTFNNTVTSPTSGTFNGTSYTAAAAGVYYISVATAANLSTGATTSNNSLMPILYVNGNYIMSGMFTSSGGNLPQPASRGMLSTMVSLAANDVVTIKVQPQNNLSTSLVTTDGTTRLTIVKM